MHVLGLYVGNYLLVTYHMAWPWWGNKFTELWNFTLFFLFILQMVTAVACPVTVEADHAYFCKIFFTAEWPQFFFLHWLYGPCRTQASFRIRFQASVSLAAFLQKFLSLHFRRPTITNEFPMDLYLYGVFLDTFFAFLTSGILSICPNL